MTANTSNNTANPITADSLTDTPIYTERKQAPAPGTGQRLITATFRNPARSATIIIPSQAWDKLAELPDEYRPLLAAVLETAAKSILSKRLGNMAVWPLSIDASILTADAIMTEASGSNTEWLSREELERAWQASATRAKFINSPSYTANKAYRAAVASFAELIIKLAGKTSAYTPAELDAMLVKLEPADIESELGAFVCRRVEQLRNKPERADAGLDLL